MKGWKVFPLFYDLVYLFVYYSKFCHCHLVKIFEVSAHLRIYVLALKAILNEEL